MPGPFDDARRGGLGVRTPGDSRPETAGSEPQGERRQADRRQAERRQTGVRHTDRRQRGRRRTDAVPDRAAAHARSGVEIRTQDPDVGLTFAFWLSDLIREFLRRTPAGRVVIDDGGRAGRPVRRVPLKSTEDFRAARQGDVVHLVGSSSSIVFPDRPHSAMLRKILVLAGLTRDAVPLDHRQVVTGQQRIRRVAAAALGLESGSQPCRFLLRVDDVPSPLATVDDFRRFHELAAEYDVPYLLGVTPFLDFDGARRDLSADYLGALRACTAAGAELALHGFSHRSRYLNYASELLAMPPTALRDELASADAYLRRMNLAVLGFIAPFNAYDPLTVGVLAERFPLICGGPESVHALGYRAGPSFLMRSLYVPSYRDAYDLDVNGLGRFDRLVAEADGLTIPVTVHWANDAGRRFQGFRAIFERLRGRTRRWSDLLAEAAAVHAWHQP